jgi:hypothetical protein
MITATFAAPADELFAVLADHQDMPRWLPLLRRVDVDHSGSRQPGMCDVGSARICRGIGFGTVRETFLAWEPGIGFAYRVEGWMMPFTDHLAVVRITPRDDGGSTLQWSQHFRDRGLILKWFCPWGIRRLLSCGIRNLGGTIQG